jgi:hypothetical protein
MRSDYNYPGKTLSEGGGSEKMYDPVSKEKRQP